MGDSPFAGEGYRKIRARLRREHGVHVSGKRVLRLLRREGLLAPQRAARRRRPRLHEGRIVTDAPDVRWGTDATMAWTPARQRCVPPRRPNSSSEGMAGSHWLRLAA
ncbi:MAG: IS3 family transposase [Nocardioidaceae bacterium]|nr:IS3 family transposase [Nocardioidaceae bacterium]